MRTVDIEINGQTWPLCLTLQAHMDICERYGSMKQCLDRLKEVEGIYKVDEETNEVTVVKPEDTKGFIEEYTTMLDFLLWAAFRASDEDGENPPPVQSELLDLLSPGDMVNVQQKVLAAIELGNRRTVGVDAPKNGEGSAGEQAPET